MHQFESYINSKDSAWFSPLALTSPWWALNLTFDPEKTESKLGAHSHPCSSTHLWRLMPGAVSGPAQLQWWLPATGAARSDWRPWWDQHLEEKGENFNHESSQIMTVKPLFTCSHSETSPSECSWLAHLQRLLSQSPLSLILKTIYKEHFSTFLCSLLDLTACILFNYVWKPFFLLNFLHSQTQEKWHELHDVLVLCASLLPCTAKSARCRD